jgi:ligand-binding sensor domain-containing protein
LPDNDVRALLPASNGGPGLWIGTAKGLVFLDGERLTVEKALEGMSIWALQADAAGGVLVGAEGKGVWQRAADGAWQPLAGANLPGGIVYALHVNRAGQIWAGTDEGLFLYRDGSWRPQTLIEGTERTQVFAIAQDRRGRLWLGTDEGLFFARDARAPETLDGWLSSQPGGLVNEYIRALTFASDGSLWLGTLAGVSRYDEETWQVIRDEAALGQRINAILMDNEGHIWAGSERNGLLLWDRRAWQRITTEAGLPDNRITALYQDTQGRLWIGGGGGIGFRTADGKL